MKRAFLLIAVAFVSGCDSSIEDVRSFPSPDGQHVLQIVTELQAANDPAPWWQHVTVRKPCSKPSTRGSIASFEGREPLEVTWTGPEEVRVVVPAQLLSRSKLPSSTTRDGVKIEFAAASEPGIENTPNQWTKPTAPLRNEFSVFALTPCRGLSL